MPETPDSPLTILLDKVSKNINFNARQHGASLSDVLDVLAELSACTIFDNVPEHDRDAFLNAFLEGTKEALNSRRQQPPEPLPVAG